MIRIDDYKMMKGRQKKNEPKKKPHMICNEPQEIAVGRNASFKDPSSHEKFP